MGSEITKGLGAGTNPEIGRKAAQEDKEQIADIIRDADMVFIAAGMGGGTGTGAAPVVAEMAKEMGILTVAVITKPFSFEGKRRGKIAEEGIKELSQHVDSLITIPNEKILQVLDKDVPLPEAFKAVNDVLLDAVKGIADLIYRPGLINVDFADVKTVMSERGLALMGIGSAKGKDAGEEAAHQAITSPLLEDISLKGARGILINITGGENMPTSQYDMVAEIVNEIADEDAIMVIGTVLDPQLTDEISVTVVATGLAHPHMQPEKVVDNTDTETTRMEWPPSMRTRPEPRNALDHTPMGYADEDFLDVPAFVRRQAD